MEEILVTTAIGDGIWGNQRYQIALKTQRRTFWHSSGNSTRMVERYLLTLQGGDWRSFRSREERSVFIGESFSKLTLEEISEKRQTRENVVAPLQSIVDGTLSSVVFVIDYLQLCFFEYILNIYNWPTIMIDGKTVTHLDRDYNNILVALIGKSVSKCDEYWNTGVTIEFENGHAICVPIKVDDDFPSPEIAELSGPGVSFFVWEANEEPFA
ncbi:MAG TPA: hypothetical protein VGI16_00330 [Candidatus Acidoferrum sp.]|jgi:hypothetical protein